MVAQFYGDLERPDGQVLLKPVAGRSTDHATTEQIDYDDQIEPAFGGPNLADIARLFLVGRSGKKAPVQQAILDNPLLKGGLANSHVGCHSFTQQAAGQRNPHRLTLEIIGMLLYLAGLLIRV